MKIEEENDIKVLSDNIVELPSVQLHAREHPDDFDKWLNVPGSSLKTTLAEDFVTRLFYMRLKSSCLKDQRVVYLNGRTCWTILKAKAEVLEERSLTDFRSNIRKTKFKIDKLGRIFYLIDAPQFGSRNFLSNCLEIQERGKNLREELMSFIIKTT